MTNHNQSFITEYLRHRSPFTAYCLAYNLKDCSNYESIMSSANRLMNNKEVGGTIRSILDNIRHEVEQEVRAEMKQELLTTQRKREILASIATGEMVAVQLYKGKDCNVCTQMVRPTINQMLRAIDLDNKMVGLYPVYNRQSTIEKVPKPQQFTTNSGIPENTSPLQGDRGSFTQDNPEKNTQIGNNSQQTETEISQNHNISQQIEIKSTPIGNNGEALNETYKSHYERINSQQSAIMDNKIEPLRIIPQNAGNPPSDTVLTHKPCSTVSFTKLCSTL